MTLRCWNSESPEIEGSDSNIENYRHHLANGTSAFRDAIRERIQGSGLTPENIADRAQFAGSCIGCHQLATGLDLGRGVESPFTLGFLHVSDFEEDCGDDSCFEISSALKEVFLPRRKAVMERFLSDSCPSATSH